MNSDDTLVVERHGAVATLRINRPSVHNALNARVFGELDSALTQLQSEDIRALVVTGTGVRAFSAGADLDELTGLSADRAYAVICVGQAVLSRLDRSPVPVIAAVNGVALGGGFELALACTFTVMAEHAEFGLPEAGLGLIPGYGGTQRLARRVGQSVAAHTMLTGQRITAERAYSLGLTPVRPVAVDELQPAALGLAQQIALRGPNAVRAILLALRHGADVSLEAGLALESALAGLATGGAEAAEGISAFKAGRKADFNKPD